MDEFLQQCDAVLFDFDGTLADSYAAIAASVNHVRVHHALPPLALDDVKRHVGRGPDYLLTHTVGGKDLAANIARYREHHPSVMLEGTHLLPGAKELIQALAHAGKRLGLCSNKPRVFSEKLLQHFELSRYFEVVLGPDDVPRPKPAPDMLTAALSLLGLPASAVLYLGDMTVDIETARAAGVRVWVVPTGSDSRSTLEEARPDRLWSNLDEVLRAATVKKRLGAP